MGHLKNNITPLNTNTNGVEKKKTSNYFMTIIKEWWPYLSMFLFLLIAMNVVSGDVYVSAPVWYSIQAALVFGIVAMFIWGGPTKTNK